MKTQIEKTQILDRIVADLTRTFVISPKSVDYEIQDNFYRVLFRAKGVDETFSLTNEQRCGTFSLMRELDDIDVCWLVAFCDQKGKVVDAVNGEKQ
jgi:hypothetical protein